MIDLDHMTNAELQASIDAHADQGAHFVATPEQKRNASTARRLGAELMDRNAFRHLMLNHRRDAGARRANPNRPTNWIEGHCHKHHGCLGHYVGQRAATCECPGGVFVPRPFVAS